MHLVWRMVPLSSAPWNRIAFLGARLLPQHAKVTPERIKMSMSLGHFLFLFNC